MNPSDPSPIALAAPKESNSNSGIALVIGRYKKEVRSFVIVSVLFSRISA